MKYSLEKVTVWEAFYGTSSYGDRLVVGHL